MIAQIPLSERPRERCLDQGVRCLSLRECLALVLGSGPPGVGSLGLAQLILEIAGRGMNEDEAARAFFIAMETSPQTHLRHIRGLGPSNQAKILAAFEIGRRYSVFREAHFRAAQTSNSSSTPRKEERQALSLTKISQSLRNSAQEWIGFIPLYRSGVLGEFCLVDRGVRTHVNTDPVELFSRILSLRPVGFYLFHNHPSGELLPSYEDQELTEKVQNLAYSLGVPLLGHAIVSSRGDRWIEL